MKAPSYLLAHNTAIRHIRYDFTPCKIDSKRRLTCTRPSCTANENPRIRGALWRIPYTDQGRLVSTLSNVRRVACLTSRKNRVSLPAGTMLPGGCNFAQGAVSREDDTNSRASRLLEPDGALNSALISRCISPRGRRVLVS